MNLRKRLKRQIFAAAIASFLCVASLITFSVRKDAIAQEDQENEQGEQSTRSEGLTFRRLSLQDENGVIDPDGLRKARLQIAEMKKVQKERQAKRQGQLEEAGIAPDSWDWLGPGNIGGRIRSIVISPSNFDNMWVGSVSGGIWRTTNGGNSWFPADDFMANLSVTTIVMNPADNSIMFAGTGEGLGNVAGNFSSLIQGGGIFRSGNQGVNWTQLPATNNANFNTVNRLAISPDGAILLAATDTGIWRSTDSGTNWIQTAVGATLDIDFHPTDSARAVAGGSGVALFSTTGGLNWSVSNFSIPPNPNPTAISGRVELAYAPSSPTTVYASVNQNGGDVYRSTDGGQNYARVNTGSNLLGGQGSYDNIIWVNPLDPTFVLVGGVTIWRSTDSGMNFTNIGNCSSTSIHADQHFIVAHPAFNNVTNRTVFVGNDGGIYRAENIATVCNTSNWTNLNNTTLGITQFYGVAGNLTSGKIIGGTQDNGTVRFTGNVGGWDGNTGQLGGDGGYVAADPTNSSYFYAEYVTLGIIRSTDEAVTGSYIYCNPVNTLPNGQVNPNGGPCVSPSVGITDAFNGANFIAPFILDPNEPNRMLAGGLSLWRSNDVKAAGLPSWTVIKNPTGGSSPISAIDINPNNSDFVVVGHNNGDIFLNLNATNANPIPNWTKIDTATLPNNRIVTRLTWDPNRSPNWIYVTFGGFSSDNVYVTRDLGATWIDITGTGSTGLPNVPVRSLVFHPSNPNLLYVGTEMGIFTSPDAGATWDLPQDGPANVSVDQLIWMGGDLIAATYGRGVYRASGGFYVDCNYLGTQTGSFLQPFRTVNAAINALPLNSYRAIWMKGCNYNEPINSINKRFELRNLGGPVKIGTP